MHCRLATLALVISVFATRRPAAQDAGALGFVLGTLHAFQLRETGLHHANGWSSEMDDGASLDGVAMRWTHEASGRAAKLIDMTSSTSVPATALSILQKKLDRQKGVDTSEFELATHDRVADACWFSEDADGVRTCWVARAVRGETGNVCFALQGSQPVPESATSDEQLATTRSDARRAFARAFELFFNYQLSNDVHGMKPAKMTAEHRVLGQVLKLPELGEGWEPDTTEIPAPRGVAGYRHPLTGRYLRLDALYRSETEVGVAATDLVANSDLAQCSKAKVDRDGTRAQFTGRLPEELGGSLAAINVLQVGDFWFRCIATAPPVEDADERRNRQNGLARLVAGFDAVAQNE